MCLTSDAVYRIRDADAIFRIERKDDQKIDKTKNYSTESILNSRVIIPEVSVAPSGESFRNTFTFLRMVQSFYRRYLQNTTNNVTGAQEDHDMRPIRLRGRPELSSFSQEYTEYAGGGGFRTFFFKC